MTRGGLFGPTSLLIAGRGVGVLISFLIPVVLARALAPAEFGTYKQLFLIYATLYGIAQMGLAESLFYFLPASPRHAGRHTANALCGLGVAGLLCLGALWAGRLGLSRLLSNPALAPHLPLLGLYLMLALAASGLEIVLTARRRFAAAARAYALSDLLRTALLLLPILLLPGSLDALLLGAVAFGLLRLGAAVAQAAREFGGELRPDRTLLKRQLAYALPFELAVLVEVLQGSYHQYAVAHHFDPATFAIYSVGCLQVPLVDLVAGPACNVMMVRMAEARRDGHPLAMRAAWHDATRALALVFVPLVGLLLVTAGVLLPFLFTDAYRASVPIFMVWTASFLLAALPLDGVLRAFADTRALFVISALKLAFIAGSIGWLLSEFHLLGAVAATVASAFVAKGLMLARAGRLMRLRAGELLPWGALAAIAGCGAAAAVPALLVMEAATPIPAPARLLAAGLAYAAGYGALILVLGLWRPGRRAPGGGFGAEFPAGAAGTVEGG